MKNSFFGLVSVAAIVATLFTTPIVAQDADAKTTADDGLSLGIPADEVIGATYTKEVFNDWEMRCMRTEDGKDPCNLYQLLKNEQGNSVAEISLFGLPDNQQAALGVTIITPLETLLTESIRLSIDENPGKVYPFSFCNLQGCVARVGLLAEEVDGLKRGSLAKMRIVPAEDPTAEVLLLMPLAGFTAGLNAVLESNAANGL
ncbi:MAG: invasion associated locus B family protein [Paracoccaceae bacterium]